MSLRTLAATMGAAAVMWTAVPAEPVSAQVTRLEVTSREPAAGGQSFGAAGQYEVLRGRVHGEVDPTDRRNSIIQDIDLAPRNSRGRVEYVATFAIARPVDPARASGVLVYSVVNRGNGDVEPSADGHISVVSGWQGDVVPTDRNQSISVPVAKNPDGSSITGPALQRFYNLAAGTTTVTLRAGTGYPFAAEDQSAAVLTVSDAETTAGGKSGTRVIPREDWALADCRTVPFPGTPDPTRLCVRGGFDASKLYEFVYTARDPLVLGIGLAATRDLVAFLRHADRDATGTANPVAGLVRHTVAIGNSQSGNFIRTFINLGFNEDLDGRIVWDGAFPRIAARQTPMNFRFALPGGAVDLYEPGSEGVLWWSRYEDTVRGRGAPASLLDRCTATRTCPKIIEAFGSAEFWGLRMSPNLIGTDARADIPLPPNVRRYYMPGTTHGGGRGGFQLSSGGAPGCTLPANPNPMNEQLRALNAALVAWVADGTPPPESRYPLLSRGELVPATAAATGFPSIPGLPSIDGLVKVVLDYDYGPGYINNDVSGVITAMPPRIVQAIPTYVPRVDADGNETSGVPSVLHQAPLGTYLGWNIAAPGFFSGQICGFQGGYVPFAVTRAEREKTGDPRLSLEERYGTLEGYVCTVRRAANGAVADRLLLQEDAERMIREAGESGVLPAAADSSEANRARGAAVCADAGAAVQTRIDIQLVSTRADLVTNGDALVAVRLPRDVAASDVRVAVDGRDVTSAFGVRPDGRFAGLVTDLRPGANVLAVSVGGVQRASLTLTNHPRGGPVFSGPQLTPWECSTTEEPALGPAEDAACNAPTQLRFVYRTTGGRFEPWTLNTPVPADAETLSLPDGRSIAYIVRVERGTMNRGIHEIAVVVDPSQPWTPWQPQPQWGRKLLLKYGGGTGQLYRQGQPPPVLDDDALRRGFVVASSSMLVNGQHANFVTAAETSLMLKEHIIETYGELRFTIGDGGSGGALLQYLIADAYPGILDGLRPTQDWEDSVSGAYREFVDSAVVMSAIEESNLVYSTEDRAAIGGWGGTNVNIFNTESRRVVDYIRPDDGTRCAGEASYDAVSRPEGVRCTFQDFMASVIGRDADGAVPLLFDNVGVEYGRQAMIDGLITPAQFVDLNVRAGGFDRNGQRQAQRSEMSVALASRLYRTGQILQGRGLARVPILAIRGTNNNDYHYPYRTVVIRQRLVAANGHADNHIYWIVPPRTAGPNTLEVMDRWLSAIEADRSSDSLPTKVVRNRPVDLTSGCWVDGRKVDDLAECERAYPHEREPRTIAGDGPTISTMKCELKPLVRSDYPVTFTDDEWERLQSTFPTGVCDFSRPGIGVQPTVEWLSYSAGPGGQPHGPAPRVD